jgi:hypothetical protein
MMSMTRTDQGRISQLISKGKSTAQVNWNWQIFTDERVTERLVAACYNCPSPLILNLDLRMSATSEISAPQKLCTVSRDTVSVEHKVKLGDCTYELFVDTCSCGKPIYKLMRTCGAALSILASPCTQCSLWPSRDWDAGLT